MTEWLVRDDGVWCMDGIDMEIRKGAYKDESIPNIFAVYYGAYIIYYGNKKLDGRLDLVDAKHRAEELAASMNLAND